MKNQTHNLSTGIRKITDYSEGLTSLVAGSYVLSLALTKRNIAIRVALGVAGAYLILRSGGKLNAGSFTFDDEEVI